MNDIEKLKDEMQVLTAEMQKALRDNEHIKQHTICKQLQRLSFRLYMLTDEEHTDEKYKEI